MTAVGARRSPRLRDMPNPSRRAGDHGRLADMTVAPEPWAPLLPGVEEWRQHFPIDETRSYHIRQEYDEVGRLVEWAVTQNRQVAGERVRVVVYDTCHGKGVHVHFYDRDDIEFAEQAIGPVGSYADLNDGLDAAVDTVSHTWADNERRSDRGR